jgi:hypothetical protein
MAQKSGGEQFKERINDMTKRVLTIIALITFLNASLFGQSPAPDRAPTRPRDVARICNLKRQAVRLATGEYIRVEKQDWSVLTGRLVAISDDGIKVMPSLQRNKAGKSFTGKAPKPEPIPFDQIHKLERWTKKQVDQDAQVFGAGFFMGLLGPLGWLCAYAIATGQD